MESSSHIVQTNTVKPRFNALFRGKENSALNRGFAVLNYNTLNKQLNKPYEILNCRYLGNIMCIGIVSTYLGNIMCIGIGSPLITSPSAICMF